MPEMIFSKSERLRVLVAISICGGLAVLTITAVTVALPTISDELDASFTYLQWIITAYALVLAALLIPASRLCDMIGHRQVFVAGSIIFGVGSVVCAAAPNPTVIIAGRIIQAVGAAMIAPTGTALIVNANQPNTRAMQIAWASGSAAVLSAFGPLIGGALTTYLGWRSVFWINIPFVIIALALLPRRLRPMPPQRTGKIDLQLKNATALAVVVIALFLVLINGRHEPTWLIIVQLVVAAIALMLFLRIERRSESRLLDPELLRNPIIGGATLIRLIAQCAYYAALFYAVVWFQNVLNESAIMAGVLLLPAGFGLAITTVVGGKYSGRPVYPLVVGLSCEAAAALMFAIAPWFQNYAWTAAALLLLGAGAGLSGIAGKTAALNSAPPDKVGRVGGLLSISDRLSSGLGVAIAGAIFGSFRGIALSEAVSDRLQQTGEQAESTIELLQSFDLSTLIEQVGPETAMLLVQAMEEAFRTAIVPVAIAFAVIEIIAAIVAFRLLRNYREPE